MILDHVFAGECGDCIAGNEFDKRIDQLVEHVMDWLIQTRQEARRGVGSMTQ
jgi:hypothetical protein